MRLHENRICTQIKDGIKSKAHTYIKKQKKTRVVPLPPTDQRKTQMQFLSFSVDLSSSIKSLWTTGASQSQSAAVLEGP